MIKKKIIKKQKDQNSKRRHKKKKEVFFFFPLVFPCNYHLKLLLPNLPFEMLHHAWQLIELSEMNSSTELSEKKKIVERRRRSYAAPEQSHPSLWIDLASKSKKFSSAHRLH